MVFPALDSLDGITLPEGISRLTVGRDATRVCGGCSGCLLLRMTITPPRSANYLKVRPSSKEGRLETEFTALGWLEDRLLHPADGRPLTPAPVAYAEEGGYEFLLIGEVPGRDATDREYLEDPGTMVRVMGEGLRLLHGTDIADCPLGRRLDHQLAEAEARVRRGLVDVADFEPENEGLSPEDLLGWLVHNRPDSEDLLLAHGDYCLPNVMVREGELGGFVDLGFCGVSDRYQDLALAERSLLHNLRGERRWVDAFFQACGLDQPDRRKLDYYRTLDDLF